jgi:anthranilate phosphoribosyltransferase
VNPVEGPSGSGVFLNLLAQVEAGGTHAASEAETAMGLVLDGTVDEALLARWLGAFALRTPTPDELLGCMQALMSRARMVPTRTPPERILDTCGTGGAPKVFNASTLAGLVAAAAGCPVAKHGNRSRTGFGSAETISALGMPMEADPEVQARMLDALGFCFCMATRHHPGGAHAAGVRRRMSVPTLFNVVGPLCNPAGAMRQVVGVWDARLLQPVAETLARRGCVHGVVLHAEDGLDEASVCGPTRFVHVDRGSVVDEGSLDPAMFGIEPHGRPPAPARSLNEAVTIAQDLLQGRDAEGRRDMLVMNAAIAIVTGGHRLSWRDAAGMARDLLDGRRVLDLLQRVVSP